MRVGTILLGRDDVTQFARDAALADELGYAVVGVGDVPMYYRELYSMLTVVAGVAATARVGPMVTNPVSRHPAVTASAMSTLAAISHGRAFLEAFAAAVGEHAAFAPRVHGVVP